MAMLNNQRVNCFIASWCIFTIRVLPENFIGLIQFSGFWILLCKSVGHLLTSFNRLPDSTMDASTRCGRHTWLVPDWPVASAFAISGRHEIDATTAFPFAVCAVQLYHMLSLFDTLPSRKLLVRETGPIKLDEASRFCRCDFPVRKLQEITVWLHSHGSFQVWKYGIPGIPNSNGLFSLPYEQMAIPVDIHHWQSQPQQRPARNRSAFAHRGQKVVLNSKKTPAFARWSWTQALCVITLQTRIPLSLYTYIIDYTCYPWILTSEIMAFIYMVCIQDKFHDLC